jgi:hypothetical protein
MKYLKYITIITFILSLSACSKKVMDKINKDLNDPTNVPAATELPTAIIQTAFGTTGTDLAWYASLFVEQSAGADEQFYDADRRSSLTAASLVDNSWNGIYDNLMVLKDIRDKTAAAGTEPNPALLGMAQVLTAYNLAVATDMWGDIPWSEALMGNENVHPKFDSQQDIYKSIFDLLNNSISNLSGANGASLAAQDFIYGGNTGKWVKAAWSLKARYFMHLQRVVPTAVDSVLACVPKGFSAASDAFIFDKYEATQIGSNPWFDFTYNERGDLVVGKTLYDLMTARNDPRITAYFEPVNSAGKISAAPNGDADRTRAGNGLYSYSAITASDNSATVATPLMSYHELLFLQTEALARKGGDFVPALKAAIEANFVFHGLTVAAADTYFTSEVLPNVGTSLSANLQEIMTQKYIAMYEQESIEVYNDYRRTGIPTMHNPNNDVASFGFPQRFPYPSSEVTANPSNVPVVNIFKDKIWWAK